MKSLLILAQPVAKLLSHIVSSSLWRHRNYRKPYVSQAAATLTAQSTLIAAVPSESPRPDRRAGAAHRRPLHHHFSSSLVSLYHAHFTVLQVLFTNKARSFRSHSRRCLLSCENENAWAKFSSDLWLRCSVTLDFSFSCFLPTLLNGQVSITKNETSRQLCCSAIQGQLVPAGYFQRLQNRELFLLVSMLQYYCKQIENHFYWNNIGQHLNRRR